MTSLEIFSIFLFMPFLKAKRKKISKGLGQANVFSIEKTFLILLEINTDDNVNNCYFRAMTFSISYCDFMGVSPI